MWQGASFADVASFAKDATSDRWHPLQDTARGQDLQLGAASAGAGHFVHVDKPAELATAVDEFINGP